MNREKKLIVCFGPVCSGKTQWALEHQRLNKDYLRFSFDEYLYMATGTGEWSSAVASASPSAIVSMLARASVVVDSFPLNRLALRILLNNRHIYNTKVEIRIFNVRMDEAIKRNNKRKEETGKFVSFEEMRIYKKMHEDFINEPDFQEMINDPDINLIYHNIDTPKFDKVL